MISNRRGVFLLSALLLGACSGSPPASSSSGASSTPSKTTPTTTGDEDAGEPADPSPTPTVPDAGSVVSDSGSAAADTATIPPTEVDGGNESCPAPSAMWTGTITGMVMGIATVPVSGTISFNISGANVTGNLAIEVTGLTLPAQMFMGTNTCGSLAATDTVTELGETVTASVTGQITGTTASGTWSAKSTDGLIDATGTFQASAQ